MWLPDRMWYSLFKTKHYVRITSILAVICFVWMCSYIHHSDKGFFMTCDCHKFFLFVCFLLCQCDCLGSFWRWNRLGVTLFYVVRNDPQYCSVAVVSFAWDSTTFMCHKSKVETAAFRKGSIYGPDWRRHVQVNEASQSECRAAVSADNSQYVFCYLITVMIWK